MPQSLHYLLRQITLGDHPSSHSIFHIVIDIGHDIGYFAYLSLQSVHVSPSLSQNVDLPLGMVENAISDFPGKI